MAQQFRGPAVFAKDQSLMPSTEFGQLHVLGEFKASDLLDNCTHAYPSHIHITKNNKNLEATALGEEGLRRRLLFPSHRA